MRAGGEGGGIPYRTVYAPPLCDTKGENKHASTSPIIDDLCAGKNGVQNAERERETFPTASVGCCFFEKCVWPADCS